MSLFDDASLVVTPNGQKAGTLYSIKPTDGSGDLSVTRATSATRVNSAGLVESVATGVPRLDYTNGTCPSILVEPQRTNLALRSEEFDNATWTTNGLNVTVSANATTAPDGTTTADAILTTTTNGSHYLQQRTGSATAGVTYTMSVYVKKLGYDYCRILTSNTGTSFADFRFSTKTLTLGGANVVADSGKVTELEDGWFRIQVSVLPLASVTWRWWVVCLNDASDESFIGDVTKGLYVWGFQFEAGSNATSYIPTTSASVTRNADVISKTGISSLIGQTEGTVLCDINLTKLSEAKTLFVIDNGTTNEYISLIRVSSNIFRLSIKNNSGAAVAIINSIVINDARCKIGIAYKNGDYAMYVNGVLRGTSTNSTNYPTTALTQFVLSNASYGYLNDSYNVSALWKTRLSNTELAQLTTI